LSQPYLESFTLLFNQTTTTAMANPVEAPKVLYTKLFINNQWVNSVSGKTFPTVNPATEEVICQVQEGDAADVDKAVKAAKAAFAFDAPWRTMDASERGRFLFRLADEIESQIDYIAALESLDNGKTVSNSKGDIQLALSILRYYAGYADKLHGLTIPADGNVVVMTRLEPVGVVGAITPWNFPFMLTIQKVAPVLAAGCTLVLKPPEQTPLTTLYLGALVQKIGLPAGVVNIIAGYGPTAGGALVQHHMVDKISFTGSTEVGRIILKGSGDSNLKRVSLELGGKSPLIVCADAEDLDAAAIYLHEAVMINHGQCCVAGTRTFVEASIYDKVVQMMKKKAEERVVGDPFDDKTVQGPQIDATQTEKILELIESGKQEGATLVTGGKRLNRKGYFIEPTVFADVKDNMRIAKEEIFGPVQAIFKFHTLEEAIERANATNYGLGAGIFTSNVGKALMAAQRLQAGTVWVNTYLHVTSQTPFGGFKESGHGREIGLYGIEPFMEKKTITIAIPQKIS
jgi:acyl-CoA reductase-like NAD-dependent aldehyde dehydrogenase